MLIRSFLSFVVLSVLISPLLAEAYLGGDEKGNGGVAIYCPSKKEKKYEVLDLYEAKEVYGMKLEPAEGRNFMLLADAYLERIARLNPNRAKLYREYMLSWQHEAQMIPGNDFADIPDVGWAVKPRDCEFVQVVAQFQQPRVGKRYFVNADIWNQLDEENKAALMIHEFMYREGLLEKNSFTGSTGLRFFNGFIHSEEMNKATLKAYIEALRVAGYQDADAHGYSILLRSPKGALGGASYVVDFYDDNHAKSAVLGPEIPIRGPHGQLQTVKCPADKSKDMEHYVRFHSTGHAREIKISCFVYFNLKTTYADGDMTGSHFFYNLDGTINTVKAYPGDQQRWNGAFRYDSYAKFHIERGIDIRGGYVLGFHHPGGELHSVCMGRNHVDYVNSWLIGRFGDRISLRDNSSEGTGQGNLLIFDRDGNFEQRAYTQDHDDCNNW